MWGQQTKKEAINFMGMEEKKVKIFGVNQFESIKKIQRNKLTKQNFNKFKNKILFAGSNAYVNEFDCLSEFEKLCINGKIHSE